jgi:hypothetical protein
MGAAEKLLERMHNNPKVGGSSTLSAYPKACTPGWQCAPGKKALV